MSVSLSDLVSRLKLIVPPSSSYPADAQYEHAVTEAVLDYGQRVGMRRLTTISVVSGVATYTLPSDFIRIAKFPAISQIARDGIIISGTGIIPTSGFTVREYYSVRNQQLTISPTPTYTLERPLLYVAGFTLDNGVYTDLTDSDARVLLHKAAELILMQIADGVARHGWSYSIGDESVNKTALAQTIREQATAERAMYEDALKSAVAGSIGAGVRATYTASEYGSFGGVQ